MLNPFVSEYVEVINSGNGKFTIIARTDIPINTVVEICPVSIITMKDAILLGKAMPSIKAKIFSDESVMDKEYQIFAQLGELELEKRLDEGKISREEYVRILRSKVNPSALLELKSHIFMLGNGLLYQVSEMPNLVCAYHSDQKVCVFKSVRYIANGTELTYYK
jgi:hypothetical protein